MRSIHFISGLPRSGSTLLAAILRQNPRFHAGMSSPLAKLFHALLNEMSAKNEFSVFINNAQRKRMIQGLFDGFYAEFPQDVLFDTNRVWCSKLPALKELFPDSKVIACVRDVSWIIDSIERLVRKNVFEPSIIFNFQSGGTVYTRANAIAAPDGLVGYAYDALKEAYYGEQAPGRLLLVSYESLVSRPQETINGIYEFLDEPRYSHDFEHLSFDADEYDRQAGTPGLHRIRSRVEAVSRETILPPDLFQRFQRDAFWRDPARKREGVLVL